MFKHTHRFGEEQCVLHELSCLRGSAGNVKKMSCSQTSVDRMIQHSGGDAVETHHIRQCAIITLCLCEEGKSINLQPLQHSDCLKFLNFFYRNIFAP